MKKIISVGITVLCLLFGSAACAKPGEVVLKEPEKTEELRVVLMGNPPKQGMEEIYSQLDAMTLEDFGCTVRFEFVPWGNEREQLNILAASGEYDLLPGGIFSDYKQLINKNAFLDLNRYLDLVPDLVKRYQYFSETALEECEIAGGLYGLPQFNEGEVLYDSEGFFYREDLCKQWGLEEINSLDTMEAYLYRAKEEPQYQKEALITDNRIWQSLWILLGDERYIEVGSMQETPFVVYDVEENKVVCRLETEAFSEIMHYIEKWSRDGILESDMLSLSDNEGERGIWLMLQDKKPCETNIPCWSIETTGIRDLTLEHSDWEYDFFFYITERTSYYKGDLTDASVISVSSKSKHPELAVRFLEKVHTDQRYYDLLYYGVEGIHHHKQDEFISYEGIDSSNRFCYTVAGDALMYREVLPVNRQFYEAAVVEKTNWNETVREEIKTSPLAAFSYRVTGLETLQDTLELARLQFFQPLVCGYYEQSEEQLAYTVQMLYEMGLAEYMETLNVQIKEFLDKEN